MSARTRRPDTAILPLSRGDTLTVKRHLTAGETRRIFARMYRTGTNDIDPLQVGFSRVLGYLLDWTFTDSEGQPIVIRHQPEEIVGSALDALDPESYQEVLRAIEAHDDAMAKARADEKNAIRGGEKNDEAISPSPSDVTGPSTKSAPLTLMTTAS